MTNGQKLEAIQALIDNRANSYGCMEDALDIANELIEAIEKILKK